MQWLLHQVPVFPSLARLCRGMQLLSCCSSHLSEYFRIFSFPFWLATFALDLTLRHPLKVSSTSVFRGVSAVGGGGEATKQHSTGEKKKQKKEMKSTNNESVKISCRLWKVNLSERTSRSWVAESSNHIRSPSATPQFPHTKVMGGWGKTVGWGMVDG